MEENPINYKLLGIEIISISIVPRQPSLIDGIAFNFDINVESRIDADKKHLIGFVSVTIKRLDTLEVLASISTGCFFDVEDFDNHIKLNEVGRYIVPPDLENAIRPISISTTRGIMFSEFRGTYLHNAVLPVILIQSLKPTTESVISPTSP